MAEYIISERFIEELINSFSPPAEPFDGRDEIIRCRDCRSCNSECKCTNPRLCYDNGAIMHCPKVEPDGFCAWAERR